MKLGPAEGLHTDTTNEPQIIFFFPCSLTPFRISNFLIYKPVLKMNPQLGNAFYYNKVLTLTSFCNPEHVTIIDKINSRELLKNRAIIMLIIREMQIITV